MVALGVHHTLAIYQTYILVQLSTYSDTEQTVLTDSPYASGMSVDVGRFLLSAGGILFRELGGPVPSLFHLTQREGQCPPRRERAEL